MAEHKIGEGHFAAMGRHGLTEIRAAIYPESNIAQRAEYGIYGTKTQGEIAADRNGEDHADEKDVQGKSILDDRLQQAKDREDRDDDKHYEIER